MVKELKHYNSFKIEYKKLIKKKLLKNSMKSTNKVFFRTILNNNKTQKVALITIYLNQEQPYKIKLKIKDVYQ